MRKEKYIDEEISYLEKEFPEEYEEYLWKLAIKEGKKEEKIILIIVLIVVAIMVLITIGLLYGNEWISVICGVILITITFFAFILPSD